MTAAFGGLSDSVIEKIRSVFRKWPEINEVVLYGSRAMGNFREGSDIDLTIKSEVLTLSQKFQIESELDDLLLPYKIDLSILSMIDSLTLIEHIQRVGKVFYRKGEQDS